MRTPSPHHHPLTAIALPMLLWLLLLVPATGWPQSAATPTLSATLQGGGTVQLIWRATLNKRERAVLYRQANNAGPEPLNPAGQPAPDLLENGQTQGIHRDTDARRGTEYRYWLQVESRRGKPLRRSETTTLTVHDLRPPGRVAGLTAQGGADDITLSWTAPDDPEVSRLTLYRRAFDRPPSASEADSDRGEAIAQLSPTQTGYVDPQVQPGMRYYYRIAATDPYSGEGPDSYAALGALQDTVSPPPVPLFRAEAGEDGQVRLAWHASKAPDVSVYRIYRSVDNGRHELLIRTVPATRQPGYDHLDRLDPTSPFSYRYRVVAVDLSGNASPSSPVAVVRLPDHTPPGAPVITGITLSDDGPADGIELTWAAPPEPDVAGYYVYRREDSANAATNGDSGDAPMGKRITPKPGTRPGLVDRSVVSGVRYGYRVTAIDRSGNEGPPSRWVTQRARLRVTDTGPLDNVRVITNKKGHPVVKWTGRNTPQIRGYRVLRGDSPAPGVQISPLLEGNTFVDRSPLPGPAWYRVQALYRNGLASEPSNPASWAPRGKRP